MHFLHSVPAAPAEALEIPGRTDATLFSLSPIVASDVTSLLSTGGHRPQSSPKPRCWQIGMSKSALGEQVVRIEKRPLWRALFVQVCPIHCAYSSSYPGSKPILADVPRRSPTTGRYRIISLTSPGNSPVRVTDPPCQSSQACDSAYLHPYSLPLFISRLQPHSRPRCKVNTGLCTAQRDIPRLGVPRPGKSPGDDVALSHPTYFLQQACVSSISQLAER